MVSEADLVKVRRSSELPVHERASGRVLIDGTISYIVSDVLI